jgi:hypothetical protein
MMENHSPIARVSITAKIALFIWMTAIFLFHLLMFSPPFVLSLASHFGFRESLDHIHDQVMPFFQTSDFSTDIDFR